MNNDLIVGHLRDRSDDLGARLGKRLDGRHLKIASLCKDRDRRTAHQPYRGCVEQFDKIVVGAIVSHDDHVARSDCRFKRYPASTPTSYDAGATAKQPLDFDFALMKRRIKEARRMLDNAVELIEHVKASPKMSAESHREVLKAIFESIARYDDLLIKVAARKPRS